MGIWGITTPRYLSSTFKVGFFGQIKTLKKKCLIRKKGTKKIQNLPSICFVPTFYFLISKCPGLNHFLLSVRVQREAKFSISQNTFLSSLKPCSFLLPLKIWLFLAELSQRQKTEREKSHNKRNKKKFVIKFIKLKSGRILAFKILTPKQNKQKIIMSPLFLSLIFFYSKLLGEFLLCASIAGLNASNCRFVDSWAYWVYI